MTLRRPLPLRRVGVGGTAGGLGAALVGVLVHVAHVAAVGTAPGIVAAVVDLACRIR